MSQEEVKQLLNFTTGSDRVPVGGLAKLKLIIAKNGEDSERYTKSICLDILQKLGKIPGNHIWCSSF